MSRISLLVIGLMASCAPAYAAPQCGPQEAVIAFITNEYGETVQSNGLTGSPEAPTLMELWANRTTGTWTITFSEGQGVLCMMASGTGYFEAAPTEAPANL